MSGGQEFSVSDLHALAAGVPMTVVLDGFDEIATPTHRARVVAEIENGVGRLGESALSLQTIVTSRPTAMPDSPTFDPDRWTFLSLGSIGADLAIEYADKWSDARKLDPQERTEISDTLREKIKSAHLRDLARNPMQLTILLSLIHLRGQSLPDQRTAMYESYVEVFFNREAEKTAIVRDHRQLLIDLHGYLAWRMHSGAELSGEDGRLTAEELQTLMKDWLLERGHKSAGIEELFEGVVERIVAIVSRVQGTFEFEVQPLREYFAAHHLYHTAPHSPPGMPQTGTQPQILEALLPNPYWQNVLRFFAGFYSSGEIPGLASQLIDRLELPNPATPVYDRAVAVNLLGDWVFHQDPIWTERLCEATIDDLLLRVGRGQDRPYNSKTQVLLDLPFGCGGEHVADAAWQRGSQMKCAPSIRSIAEIAARHSRAASAKDAWIAAAAGARVADARRMLAWGQALGVVNRLTSKDVELLRGCWAGLDDIDILLLRAGCGEALSSDVSQADAWDRALDGDCSFRSVGAEWSRLGFEISAYGLRLAP